MLYNPGSGADEHFHKIGYLVGKESEVIDAVPAGDIGAVSKLHDTATGDTLGPKAKPVRVGGIERPVPVLATAIEAANQADEDKLANSLRRLQEEDPALVVTRSDETHQTLLQGMGETHLAITIEKLKRKFGVEVVTEEVQVPYRETVTRPSKAEGKYKKQTGGRGQFGVAMLEVEPLPRGTGFEFVDAIKGGPSPASSSRRWRPGSGTRCGTAGSTDSPLSTSGSAASTASTTRWTRRRCPSGWRDGSDSSRRWPTPADHPRADLAVSVTVPSDYQGDVMGDLSSRRGQVQGTEVGPGGMQVITALVPTSEIMRYAIDLRSLTQGWGTFEAVHDHYDELPQHLGERVLASLTKD